MVTVTFPRASQLALTLTAAQVAKVFPPQIVDPFQLNPVDEPAGGNDVVVGPGGGAAEAADTMPALRAMAASVVRMVLPIRRKGGGYAANLRYILRMMHAICHKRSRRFKRFECKDLD
jgi:hypothetical protein